MCCIWILPSRSFLSTMFSYAINWSIVEIYAILLCWDTFDLLNLCWLWYIVVVLSWFIFYFFSTPLIVIICINVEVPFLFHMWCQYQDTDPWYWFLQYCCGFTRNFMWISLNYSIFYLYLIFSSTKLLSSVLFVWNNVKMSLTVKLIRV